MVLILMIPVILVLIIVSMCYGEIRMFQAPIRHGNRYPTQKAYAVKFYPNDPYINYTWAPYGSMKLTNKGKINTYKLGKLFQNRYKNLLGTIYKANEIFFGALDSNRTINTAQLIASGIYPEFRQRRNQSSGPIQASVHVEVGEKNLYYPMIFCENYFIDRQKADLIVAGLFDREELQKFSDYLAVHTTVKFSPFLHSWFLYNSFVAQVDLGLELKPWTDSIFPNGKLLEMTAFEYRLQTYTNRMKRLVGGVWIKSFLDHADNFVNHVSSDQKANFFVASEMHVAAILNTLGVYTPHFPSYLSAVIFELHEINREFYIQVVHRNEDRSSVLIIPGCDGALCRLEQFKKVLKDVTLYNFDKDCGNRDFFPIL
ncbi:GSCOCT00014100001.2-RA-CDS [Cotesia congregata]|uniref:acid phosphatase n=1 Tax=Cotesia congregata TaxID=51543 RepID=A0A8J2HNS5_COTCN|nr:GSCOCT00014100001.2-RA-CDS [Cotesia congregata]CAG5106766.1 Putative venom protein 18 [Cotesia congregata]